jgi:hypothetical protein
MVQTYPFRNGPNLCFLVLSFLTMLSFWQWSTVRQIFMSQREKKLAEAKEKLERFQRDRSSTPLVNSFGLVQKVQSALRSSSRISDYEDPTMQLRDYQLKIKMLANAANAAQDNHSQLDETLSLVDLPAYQNNLHSLQAAIKEHQETEIILKNSLSELQSKTKIESALHLEKLTHLQNLIIEKDKSLGLLEQKLRDIERQFDSKVAELKLEIERLQLQIVVLKGSESLVPLDNQSKEFFQAKITLLELEKRDLEMSESEYKDKLKSLWENYHESLAEHHTDRILEIGVLELGHESTLELLNDSQNEMRKSLAEIEMSNESQTLLNEKLQNELWEASDRIHHLETVIEENDVQHHQELSKLSKEKKHLEYLLESQKGNDKSAQEIEQDFQAQMDAEYGSVQQPYVQVQNNAELELQIADLKKRLQKFELLEPETDELRIVNFEDEQEITENLKQIANLEAERDELRIEAYETERNLELVQDLMTVANMFSDTSAALDDQNIVKMSNMELLERVKILEKQLSELQKSHFEAQRNLNLAHEYYHESVANHSADFFLQLGITELEHEAIIDAHEQELRRSISDVRMQMENDFQQQQANIWRLEEKNAQLSAIIDQKTVESDLMQKKIFQLNEYPFISNSEEEVVSVNRVTVLNLIEQNKNLLSKVSALEYEKAMLQTKDVQSLYHDAIASHSVDLILKLGLSELEHEANVEKHLEIQKELRSSVSQIQLESQEEKRKAASLEEDLLQAQKQINSLQKIINQNGTEHDNDTQVTPKAMTTENEDQEAEERIALLESVIEDNNAQFENVVSQYQEEIGKLKNELVNAQTKLKDFDSQEAEERIELLESIINDNNDQFQASISEYENRIANLETEKASLEDQIFSFDGIQNNTDSENRITILENVIYDNDERFKMACKELEQRISDLELEKAEMEAKMIHLDHVPETHHITPSFTDTKESYQATIDSLEKQIVDLLYQNAALENEIHDRPNDRVKLLEGRIADLETEKAQLEDQMFSFGGVTNDLEQESRVALLEEKVAALELEKAALEEQLFSFGVPDTQQPDHHLAELENVKKN